MARVAVSLLLSAFAGISADWNPKLAAEYLDARQKDWFVWPRANGGAKPCVSCHTGVSYLLARPVLRKALGESAPTTYETGLLNSLRGRVEKRDPPSAPGIGVESVLAALFLGNEGSPEAAQALDRMWALQIRDGSAKGSWNWFSLNDDPWEMPESNFYGATLAAMAVGSAPADYRARPEVKERVGDLTAFLRNGQEAQPLHNRLMLLWASAKLPDVLPAATRRAIVERIVEAAGARRRMDLGLARTVQGARAGAAAGRQQRLCDGADRVRPGADRGRESEIREGARLAAVAPGSRGRVLGGRVDESPIRGGLDGIEVHARRRDGVRKYGAIGGYALNCVARRTRSWAPTKYFLGPVRALHRSPDHKGGVAATSQTPPLWSGLRWVAFELIGRVISYQFLSLP